MQMPHDHPIKIVGLGGSLGRPSQSLAALQVVLRGAQESEAEVELLSIRELDLPMFVPGEDGRPPGVSHLLESVRSADGMVWASPLYHGTISGAFKNALDWLQLLAGADPPYLTDKVIGLVSTAGGVQGLQAVNTMEFVARALRAYAVPLVVPVAQAGAAFDAEGAPTDERVGASLLALGREVVRVSMSFHAGAHLEQECELARSRLAAVADTTA